MRTSGASGGFAFPKPGHMLIGIIAVNVVVYVLYLIGLRAQLPFIAKLPLSPRAVFEQGYIWQPATYLLLHAPDSPGHLVLNMLWLYLFGATMEQWWGGRRFLFGYVIFGLSGAALTLLIGGLSKTGAFGGLLDGIYRGPHIGASGAVMGMVVAWGITNANQTMNFFLLGEMKGKTFVLIIIAFELLVALSLDRTSSTSHFGGMLGAAILCKGLWRPAKWSDAARRAGLKRKQKKIERDLKLIRGGKDDEDPPAGGNGSSGSQWN